MMEEKKLKLPGYKRTESICSKCGWKTTVESDFLSEAQAFALHKCRKGKGEK